MKKTGSNDSLIDTKARILDIAEDLFSEKGYDSTGIDEIARGVGISKSVIYYHFKNKEQILGTIIESYFREIIQLKLEKAKEFFADPTRLREAALGEMMSLMSSKKKTIRILLMESIKRKQDIPILSLWDINNQKWTKDFDFFMSKLEKEDLPRILVDSFFFGFLPMIGYIIFGDAWSSKVDIDKTELEKLFSESLLHHHSEYLKPERWR